MTGPQFLDGVSAGLVGLAVFVASAGASAVARVMLARWQVLDTPNPRSSHKHPVPRGGGVGFMLVILVVWLVLWQQRDPIVGLAVIVGALGVAAISFADDLRGVAVWQRLLVQAAAVCVGLTFFSSDGPILANFLPIPVDRIVAGGLWLWFINLFNFMDGIDGIAGAEAGVIAVGIAVLAVFRPELPALEAIVVGAAALGFLVFNWPPARLFMGDVGSTGLGFVLGYLLLITAAKGAPVPALLLPLYFAADATTTLAYRAWRRQPLGVAHRDHAYQRGVDGGLTHAAVSVRVVVLGLLLIIAAVIALDRPAVGLGVGLMLTAGLLAWLRLRPATA